MRRWRQLHTRHIVHDQWISLRADTCELPNGDVIAPYYVLEDPGLVEVFAQNHHGEVLLVRQYRYGGDSVYSELPGGVIEHGETPLNAAKRELREETGYVAEAWTEIGRIFANPARQTNLIHAYIAHDLSCEGQQMLDRSEEITFGFRSIDEIKAMIRTGDFLVASDIAAFYMCIDAGLRIGD